MDESICRQLALPYPLGFKESDPTSCPQFCLLLNKLSKRLSTGLTNDSKKELDAVNSETEVARRKFLKEKVRLEVLNELIFSTELRCLPASSQESKLVDRLEETLVTAECQSYLDLGKLEGEQVTTLGLEGVSPGPTDPSLIITQVLYLLEDILFEKCSRLLNLMSPGTLSGSSKSILHPHIVRLPDKIQDVVESNKRSEAELREMWSQWETACGQQLAISLQLVEQLEQLVRKFYTGSKLEANSILIQYLLAKCETIVLKLKCLQLDITNATYTKDSIRAIRIIRDRLMEQIRTCRTEVTALEVTLHQYRIAGPEFSELVKDYARIQKEIQGKEWALKELSDG